MQRVVDNCGLDKTDPGFEERRAQFYRKMRLNPKRQEDKGTKLLNRQK